MPKNPALLASFAQAYACAQQAYGGEAVSAQQLTMQVPVPGAHGTHPVQLYRGEVKGTERVNIAAPVFGHLLADCAGLAHSLDAMPVGALRLLGDIPHVHDSFEVSAVGGPQLTAWISTIAAVASELSGAESTAS